MPREDYPIRPQFPVPMGDGSRVRTAEAGLWTGANPVLDEGEPGYDGTDFKIGDGITAWNDLPAVGGGGGGGSSSGLSPFPPGAVGTGASMNWNGDETGANAVPGAPGGTPNIFTLAETESFPEVDDEGFDLTIVHDGLYYVTVTPNGYQESGSTFSFGYQVSFVPESGAPTLFNTVTVEAAPSTSGVVTATSPQPLLVPMTASGKISFVHTGQATTNFPFAGGYPGWGLSVIVRPLLMTDYAEAPQL